MPDWGSFAGCQQGWAAHNLPRRKRMSPLQDRFDDAMFAFSAGRRQEAAAVLRSILAEDPGCFDAQLALGGVLYAMEDYAGAVAEGRKAELLRPNDQWVYTNLSRAFMKAGDKRAAEHYAAQARIASWRGNMEPPGASAPNDSELPIAKPEIKQ
jgi:Flp pilus assembly protein TadD